MNLRAAILPGQMGRKPLIAFGFLVAAGYAAYRAAGYVINDDLQSLALIGLAFLAGACVLAMLNDWRLGLYFFLAWLLFEDFARKFLGNNMVVYFGKDLLVIVVYISFYLAVRRRQETIFRPPFLLPLLIFVWFGAVQIFNPGSNSFWFGALGFRVYFLYVPLLVIGYSLLTSEEQLRKFFTVNIVLGLVIVSLGVAQAILGHTFLNPQTLDSSIEGAAGLYRVSPISGALVYRPSATFVSHGRYVDFMQVLWLIVLGFSGYLLLRHRSGRALAFVALALTAAGTFLSGSRGSFMWTLINTVVFSAAFLWGAPWRQKEVVRVLRTFQRLAIGMALAFVALFLVFPDALSSRLEVYSETLLPNSPASELGQRVWDYPIRNFLGAFNDSRWPYGYGIGAVSLGSQYVTRYFKVQPVGVGVESGFGSIVLELGIVGLALWLVMAAAIVACAWRVVRKLKGTPWFPAGFVIAWYAFALLFLQTFVGIQAYQDFLMNAYLWLLLGILFRLPHLGQAVQQQALQQDLLARPATMGRSWIR